MILLVMLVVVPQVFGQRKGKVDPEEAKIDSLTIAVNSLNAQLDSVSKERDLYFGVYSTIKEEVFKYDFNPSKTALLIDSLRTSIDSTTYGLTSVSASLQDSLSTLKIEYAKLKAVVDSINITDVNKDKLVTELKQLKELLDAKIITQADFDAKKTLIMEEWK